MLTNLHNKTILIIGATGAIGRAIALEAASYGARLILLGKTELKLNGLFDEIVSNGFKEPYLYQLDLLRATSNDYAELQQALLDNFPTLDAVYNCAGILGKLTPIEHYTDKDWHEVMQVNLNAAFMLSKAVLPILRRTTLSKDIAHLCFNGFMQSEQAYFGAYHVAGQALTAMLELLAQELEYTKIKVILVKPGKVLSEMRVRAFPALDASTMLMPYKLASSYLELLSKDDFKRSDKSLYIEELNTQDSNYLRVYEENKQRCNTNSQKKIKVAIE